jgi:transposase
MITSLQSTIENCNATIANLNSQIEYLTKKLFGTSSEKRCDIEGQMNLFDEAEQECDPLTLYLEEEPLLPAKSRKPRRTSRETFKGVPVRRELITLAENAKNCPVCDTPLEKIGEEFVRREFHFTPAKGEIIEYYTETYKCPECTDGHTEDESYCFVKSELPKPLIPHSYASASAVAWTMYQKYANALPLYRQEKDWKQFGAELSRATLANWIIYCSQEYLEPMYRYFHKELLKREFLMADETRIQVLKEQDRKPQTDSFMWLFRSGEDGLPAIILYHYTQTRARYHAQDFLTGFSGYLETDGYQGYNDLPGVKRCCCFAHIRRYFIDAVPKGKEYDYSNPAVQGIQFCNQLFHYERICKERNYSYEQRYEYRNRKARPVLDSFKGWLKEQTPRRGSRFEKAVNYVLNRESFLGTYLEDGRCSFSNNLSENAIRPFTVGRKNWLFSNTPKGACASATVYTMVEMAKAHNLNIFQYLTYLLEHRPNDSMSDDQLESFAPWSRDVIASCSN